MEFFIKAEIAQRIFKLLSIVAKAKEEELSGKVLIEVCEDKVIFMANDESTAITITTPNVNVVSPGATAISFNKLRGFINAFSVFKNGVGVKDFNFKKLDRKLKIVTENLSEDQKAKNNLSVLFFDPNSIIKPKIFNEATIILNSDLFKEATSKVLYAINPAESRSFIRGLNLKIDKDFLYFAGTNGEVLSEYKIENSSGFKTGNYTFEYNFIMGLRRAIGDETQLFMDLNNGGVKVKFDDICFYGRMVVGESFPAYQALFEDYKNEIVLNKAILMNNLKPIIGLLDKEDYNRITIEIKNKIFSVYNTDTRFDIELNTQFDKGFISDVNGSHFIHTIESIKDDDIVFRFSNAFNSLIFNANGLKNQAALIKPIRRR